MYETVTITNGFCPHCGKPYGYVREKTTGQLVNEFSKCECKTRTREKDVYEMQTEAIKAYVKRTREEVA